VWTIPSRLLAREQSLRNLALRDLDHVLWERESRDY
jgi:hypothetical protein